MPARRRLVSWSAAIIFGAAILVALSRHHSPPAQAQDPDPPPEEPPPPAFETPAIGPQGPARFSLAPADEGALQYDDLSDVEKEATDIAASIHEVEHSPEAVAGWSAISQQAAEQAAVRRAEYEAGMEGMEDMGVE